MCWCDAEEAHAVTMLLAQLRAELEALSSRRERGGVGTEAGLDDESSAVPSTAAQPEDGGVAAAPAAAEESSRPLSAALKLLSPRGVALAATWSRVLRTRAARAKP